MPLSHRLRRIQKRLRLKKISTLMTVLSLAAWPLPGQLEAHAQEAAQPVAPAEASVAAPVQSLPDIPDRLVVRQTITLTVTAYSSTVDQTDADPFTTASGEKVRDGIIAYNALPFGTCVRFPDQFGDKIFVVKDRMHPRKGRYVADIWMETRDAAIQWGAPVVRMEVLGT